MLFPSVKIQEFPLQACFVWLADVVYHRGPPMKNRKVPQSLRLAPIFAIIVALAGGLSTGARAQTETALFSFEDGDTGATPRGSLVFDSAGNLYGTTYSEGDHGYGTVFKLAPKSHGGWEETVLYSFTGGGDSGNPWAGLTIDASGSLYGTTTGGVDAGYGSVFELAPASGGSWKETTLHKFSGGDDGAASYGRVILDAEGNLYGTTNAGGDLSACNGGCGVVFKLAHNGWKETVLYTFKGKSDGAYPEAGLAMDSSGNLYGTTAGGGTDFKNCGSGCGVAFKLSSSDGNWRETVMHSFSDGDDGGLPNAPFVLDGSGNLYSTTPIGGDLSSRYCGVGCGTVYELSVSKGAWKQTVLYKFTGTTDGAEPGEGGLMIDAGGALYGTTPLGGNLAYCDGVGCGTVFEVSRSDGKWKEEVSYAFTDGTDGGYPFAPPVLNSTGDLYGTATSGGTAHYGVVYEITP
jgi:uncharacterized repeat protein (TIGR03803 family)